ncbi:hypothetical protein SAMN05421766_103318 [Zobellia uliginosa]|uniref:Uncharacterized protein n=1 Tax=Zobellia uliginosa TaxID=143224 RepID=A0ABY1KTM3_9FLAO|nr:hypothetical protein [Zobellia uliginosa]SIS67793.1 hypothetical protein SAMN05421766_103318 [Zobellia uliginosa]
MAQVISSLKQNRPLLKKRKFKDLGEVYKNGIDFKKLSDKEGAMLKQKINEQHQNNKSIEIIIYALSIVVNFSIPYYTYWFIVG